MLVMEFHSTLTFVVSQCSLKYIKAPGRLFLLYSISSHFQTKRLISLYVSFRWLHQTCNDLDNHIAYILLISDVVLLFPGIVIIIHLFRTLYNIMLRSYACPSIYARI